MSVRRWSSFASMVSRRLGVAGVVLALVMQWCIPAVHAMHDALVGGPAAAEYGHHHHGDHHHADHGHHHHGHDDHHPGEPQPGAPGHEHNESECPTCQQFVSLRSFVPLSPAIVLVAVALHDADLCIYDTPFISCDELTIAVPRGPPGGA